MVVVRGRTLQSFISAGLLVRTVAVHVTHEQFGRLRDGQPLFVRLGDELFHADSYAYMGRSPGGMRKVLRAIFSASDQPRLR